MRKLIDKVDISDCLIERPIGFSIKGRHFLVYHNTLGKVQLISRLLEVIGFGPKNGSDIYSFCTFIAHQKREECLRLITYSTLPGKDCLDENKVQKQLSFLKRIDDEDICVLLITILTMDKSDDIMKHFGMDKESERLARVIKAKGESKGSIEFGGRSIWGTIIDAACERYGWTLDYVLWGISYSNLKLLLSDHIRTVFLTDKERKNAHISTDNIIIKAEDSGELERFIKSNNWR